MEIAFAVFKSLPYPCFMAKNQASHILPLYFLCGALLCGVLFLSFVNKKQEIDFKRANLQSEKQVIDEPDPVILAEQIRNPAYMDDLVDQAIVVSRVFAGDPADLFENPFSVFTDVDLFEIERQSEARQTYPYAQVVIIIDDMGVSPKWSREVAELPGPLTLSYLPYAENLQRQADHARGRDHQLMLHMPMQAMGDAMDQTPGLLRVEDDQEHFLKYFQENLDAFEGFSGVNNHMGSRLTQDEAKMALVMAQLKRHGLYFIDSRTIHSSVAALAAEEASLPHLVRDVFLDHEDTLTYARAALQRLEEKAYRDGVAIAIGHPKEVTVQALKEWLPTLTDKNIRLIGAEDLIRQNFPGTKISYYSRRLNFEVGRIAVREAVD